MALATQIEVEAALRRELTDDESEQLDGLIAEATDLVAGYLHPCEIPDPAPEQIVRVVASMAAAVLARPKEILPESQGLNAGMYGVTLTPGSTSQGPYLTAAMKLRLRPYKCGSGVVSVALGSERR